MQKLKNKNWKKIISIFVMASFIIPIGFLSYKIATTTNDIVPGSEEIRVRSDYVLMLLQCLLGIVAMGIPSYLNKKFSIEIPNKMYYFYILFLYAAIFLGEIRSYYYRYEYWDLILHALSGTMIGFLGFSVVDILNRENEHVNLDPFFVAFFAFCFAMMLGGVWEVYEFISDGVLGTNMQKFAIEGGAVLQGREAVLDTMEDIIVDGIGAIVASTVGYLSIKYDFSFLNSLKIRFRKKTEEKEEVRGGTDETAHLK